MKIIFLGTPEFAVPILEALHSSNHDVIAVITQPDRPKGRRLVLTPPPVKLKAQQLDIPLFQPENVSNPQFLEEMQRLSPDVAVVAAFGQIFKKELLELPKFGCWNVHASLLPRYRGASPIVRSILAGEKESGATIMKMGLGIDDGPTLDQVKVSILPNMTAGELEEQISRSGADLMVQSLKKIASSDLSLSEQDSDQACYAAKLKKEEACIDWNQDALVIHNQIRALSPFPGAYTLWKGDRLKIWRADFVEVPAGRPGEVLRVEKEGIWVSGQSNGIALQEVQLPGKRVMSLVEFAAGHPLKVGDQLGDVASSV